MKQSATLSTLATKYLKVNRRIEQSTVDLTRRAFGYLIESVGDIAVGDFTLAEAEEFQADLVNRGLNRGAVNTYTKSISPVFSWAVVHGVIEKNPFGQLKNFKVARKRVEVYTPHEIERIVDNCPGKLWIARVMLGLSSLRRGEVLNLTVQDIDFEKGLIYIQPKGETAYTWRWPVKDHEQRRLPLIPQLSKLLLEIYETMPHRQPYLLLKPQRYSHLLRNKTQMNDRIRKCPDNNFGRTFRSICRRALTSGGFHKLRKTALTELTSGLRLQEVQEIAGHSSVETTRVYLAIRDDLLTRAGDILERGVAQFG